jgi:dienelactone hydrolase
VANVVLFHSSYGLRPAVRDAAARLRAAGHTVDTPDLYAGRVTDSFPEALIFYDQVELRTVLARAREAIEDIPPGTVLAGFSLGAVVAVLLGADDPRVGALVLLHGIADPPFLVSPGLPVQVHVAEDDALVPPARLGPWAAELCRLGARPEVHDYPGGHLFTDPGLPDFEPLSTERTWDRVERFLATLSVR